MDFPPFPGFRPEAFTFLRQLAENNDRDWFKPRKAVFEDEVQWPMQCLVADSARRASEEGLPLTGDPKKTVFRIHRDTRFSKDKRPYKTHVGAVLTRTGGRDDVAGVYVHVEPERCFLAGGFWEPPPDLLKRFRARIANDPDAFQDVLDSLNTALLTPMSRETALKRMPQGYDAYADHPHADYLKWKSYVVSRSVPDADLQSPGFTEAVIEMMRDVQGLLEFGWRAAEDRL
jgi:uncharacterized protein (TIGR02453 family)